MPEPRIVRAKDGFAFQYCAPQSRSERILVLVAGNKAGMKFMLMCFLHEVALALDGMAGTLGCTQLWLV